MNAAAFNEWLAKMKLAGIAKSDRACARLLGVSPNAVVIMKKKGTDYRTALACSALLAGLSPYR